MNVIEPRFRSGGINIQAKIVLPPGIPSRGTVILLSGDGRSGLSGSTWPTLTEMLEQNGLVVVGFDFRGQGRSEGTRDTLTLETAAENFRDFVTFLKKDYAQSLATLHVVASSFGAAVLLTQIETIGTLKSAVLKSPAIDLAEAYRNDAAAHNETISSWKLSGVSPGIGLPYKAYLQATNVDLRPKLRLIKAPTLIVQGDEDEIVPIGTTRRITETYIPDAQLLVLSGVRHDYKQNQGLKLFWDATMNHILSS